MQFLKFSLLLFALSLNTNANFSSIDCLNTTFETTVSHKSFPFGLLKKHLSVNKDKCVVEVNHLSFKVLKKKWTVDVCRGPVHIKSGAGAVNVVKRESGCPGNKEFCGELMEIEEAIQDDGLIFAEGEKEDLGSDHGKIYCGFLLIEKYLREGIVLSRDDENIDLFNKGSKKEIVPVLIEKGEPIAAPEPVEESSAPAPVESSDSSGSF